MEMLEPTVSVAQTLVFHTNLFVFILEVDLQLYEYLRLELLTNISSNRIINFTKTRRFYTVSFTSPIFKIIRISINQL